MPKAKKRKRSILAPILALLLVLALAGTLLFSAFRDKIEHWEYPQRFTEYVEYYAGKYGIDPMILYAFIRTESNFDPNADSDAGARGLMQIRQISGSAATLSATAWTATAAIWPPPPRPTTAAWAPWTVCSGRRRTQRTALRWTITLTRRCGST